MFGIGGVDHGVQGPMANGGGQETYETQQRGPCHRESRPYAVQLLVEVARAFGASFVAQHPEMPCAKLFDPGYDHTTHPATLLLYRALAFSKPPGLDHYVWSAQVHPPLERSYASALERMDHGLPVVG